MNVGTGADHSFRAVTVLAVEEAGELPEEGGGVRAASEGGEEEDEGPQPAAVKEALLSRRLLRTSMLSWSHITQRLCRLLNLTFFLLD